MNPAQFNSLLQRFAYGHRTEWVAICSSQCNEYLSAQPICNLSVTPLSNHKMTANIFLLAILSCSKERCPEGMVFLQGGTFTLGEEPPEFSWQLMGRPFEVSSFCMDRYEFPNRFGEYPRSGVTFNEAKALCTQFGKRLCTEPEWEFACQGSMERLYSYGHDRVERNCHTRSTTGEQPFAKSGEYPNCQSPEGVFDLNGNLSEWVDATWPQTGTSAGNWKTLRGGTIEKKTHYGQDCTSRHGHDANNWRNSDDGFRCCAEP